LSFARIAALGALALAVVLVGFVLLRGDGGTTYYMVFQNAGQLVNGNDVQVGGRRVGSVDDIKLTSENLARIEVTIEEEFAPLREGTKATIRLTSLSGIANRYIALEPAPNSAPGLEEEDELRLEDTTPVVDLDQIFNTLDPKARKSLQQVVNGFATWYEGRESEANESARYFNPLLSTTRDLVGELTRDDQVLTRFLVDSADVVTAIAERRDDLSGLVQNANTTARAIATENTSLARTLDLAPDTFRRANSTWVNLRATLDDLDVLVEESLPATRRLAPFLRELRPLVRDARPTIRDLRLLVRREGEDNDLLELLRDIPELQRIASPTFRRTVGTLRQSQPVIEFIRPYAPEFVGWLRDFGQGGANYDANGHYARIQPIYNAFQFTDTPDGGRLTPIPAALRGAGLTTDNLRRCPGAASQPRPDGSSPWQDDGRLEDDCDPDQVPPGP
jgi:phospholipid/cholesterol/gamma-HCH transport system substrate-binding protein